MRVAILADVHGNLIALERVIGHARGQGVDTWWFLGDVVGYGPRPVDCILALDALPVAPGGWLMGNHDLTTCLLKPLGGTHPIERLERRWQVNPNKHLSRLMPGADDLEIAAWHAEQLCVGLDSARLAEFKAAPTWNIVENEIVLAHGVVRGASDDCENVSGENSYIHPWNVLRAEESFHRAAQHLETEVETLRLLIVGHTHVPMLLQSSVAPKGTRWTWETGNKPPPGEQFSLGAQDGRWWAVLNPGSVGRPRDKDPRAAYAILDTVNWTVCFHRVEYSIRVAQAAMTPFYPEAYRKWLEIGE